MLALLRRLYRRFRDCVVDAERLRERSHGAHLWSPDIAFAPSVDQARVEPVRLAPLGQAQLGLDDGVSNEVAECLGLSLGHEQTNSRTQPQKTETMFDQQPEIAEDVAVENKATPAPNANQIAGIADHQPTGRKPVSTIVPAADAANLNFEHDLSSEVPNAAFIEGVRAAWLPAAGIVQVMTHCGAHIWEMENASSLSDAEQWVRFFDFSKWEGEQCR